MVKKTLFKYSSVLLSVVLIASTLTGCGTSTAYNQTGSEVAISSEAASNTENIITNAIKNELSISNTSTLKTNTRDEMVYVFDKADGTQDHVLVTEKVTDSKGETTTNQSTSDKTAPVSIKVTYKLNGVETKPEDMIGKSGKVTIRYDYTNNEKKNITVNGKSQIAYVPFTMITGTLLPTDKFSNVEVTNGKVSKVGDNIIALGMTMPGLKDTLNLKFDGESLDMDIPEYFEISADVEDFELDMSMSVATTSTLNDIDTDDFSLAKLEDKMNELQSAADQLTDGTVTLQNGTQTLSDSIPALTDGVNQLNDGIYAYTDGATALAAGAGQLKDGISAYTAGANQLGAGAGQLQSGLKTYTDGVGALNAGSGTLQSGLSTYTGGVASAEAGASQLNEGIKSIKTALIGNVVKELAANSTAYKMNSVADSTGKTVMEQAADLQKLGTALGLSDVTIATDLSDLGKKSSSEAATDISAYFVKYLTAYTTNIITETYTEAMTSGKPYSPQVSQAGSKDYVYVNQLGLLIKAAGNIGASSALDAVVSNLSNNETINAALKQLTEGSQSLTDGLGELVKNNDTLNAGASQLNAGLAQLSGNNDTLNGGIAQISAGLAQLNDNNDALNGGIEQIAGGFSTLNSNNEALRSGSTQLADGTSTLKSSSVTLADGVTQLNDGAITLKDGMAEFNETGIKAITSLVGDDADTAVDTIKEVIKLGQNYNTFLGKSDGKDNSVTFIYKTAELTK